MSGSAEQVRRLLNLVPYLLQHPGARVSDVAAEFGVTERQLNKDLGVLWFCGLPGGFADDLMEPTVEDGGAIYLRNAEAIVHPLRLSTREAVALLVALRALAQLPGLADRDALARASAKLEGVAGDAAEVASRVSVAFEARESVLDTMQRALATGRRIHLRYYVPSRDEVTERDVDPMRLPLIDGRAYLEGWCRVSEGVRLFRLDRVVSVELLAVPAEVPKTATAADLDDGAMRPSTTDPLVTLEVEPDARWVAENYPCEDVEELPGGRLRLSLRATDPGRIRRLVLRLGASCEVVGPEPFVQELRGRAREALAAYGVTS